MHQRRSHHSSPRVVLASVLALVVSAGFAPRSSHAQCPTEFQDQTSNALANGGSICQTAVGNKCAFQLKLCVNQSDGTCTPKDLKKKNVRASGHCGPVGKVKVKASGTSAVCGTVAGITVRTKKHGTRTGKCNIRAKGSTLTKLTLLCQPATAPCPTTTTTTTSPTTSTTMPLPCTCGASLSGATKLSFTTGLGSGNCGTLISSTGGTLSNLACGGLYTGGGDNSVPLPYLVPDTSTSLTKAASCSGTTVTLSNLTSTDTGNNRNCSSVGCLFGPPLPIPNPASTPTSVCVVNVVATDASGTADCTTGGASISLPLTSQLYLSGDKFPNAPGIQVCPVCNQTCNAGTNSGGPCNTDTDCPGGSAGSCAGSNVCHSGANNGMPCMPADTAVTASFPTSDDCPPSAGDSIGSLPIAFDLTTGVATKTAVNQPSQTNVFCGFCNDAAGTGCFEGDSTSGCPANSACTGAGAPFPCCTGTGAGTCDQAQPRSCATDADCTDGSGAWPGCVQRSPGAFGPSHHGARTITLTGTPAGNIGDGTGHPSTLVSIFCIRPTFNATVDAAGNLPGPGAVSLPGTAQLQ